MEELPIISKEFLEEVLGQPVGSFEISPGTNIGDNYMSVIYSIDVKTQKGESFHLISKCYPSHPARQEFLNKSNIFWNELNVYQELIPEITKMAKENGITEKLPFAPLIDGKSPNFDKMRELGDLSYAEKVYSPFDIYIMMTDLRKTWGFRMSDRQVGLDFDHACLVMKAHALLHSIGWAYKQIHSGETLRAKYPFLAMEMQEDDKVMYGNLMHGSIKAAVDAIENEVGSDSELVAGTMKLDDYVEFFVENEFAPGPDGFADWHRVKPESRTSSEPWSVLLHGDCWTNNLLFRYDAENKPVEVVLVDLQMMREHCPTLDMAYLLFSSTTTEVRKAHLDTLLALYHQEFLKNCAKMKVEPLPGFTLEELKIRFHEAKVYGYFCATMVLPVMLKDAKDAADPEKASAGNMGQMLSNILEQSGDGKLYNKRIKALAQELYEQGVI